MTNDFNTYDQAMDLIREQTTALKVCRAALKGCQDENEKLIHVARFYAERDWRELSTTDRGDVARQTCREVTGE